MQTLYKELAEEVARRQRSRPLSRALLRRVVRPPAVSADSDAHADAQYDAALLQLAACRVPRNAGDLRRRMILECRRILERLVKERIPHVIVMVLLDLSEDELRSVSRLLALLSVIPVFPWQPLRRDSEPLTPRHVATPIVANAPPARLPLVRDHAERRAA